MKILLVASHFPPLIGGAPVVYENLCAHLENKISVIAPRRRYIDGGEIEGCLAFDRLQAYRIDRVDLLQPQIKPPAQNALESLRRLFFEDIPFCTRIAGQILKIVDQVRPDVVCMGDLFALFWLGWFLRLKRGLPIVHYVHAEEVTTDWGSRMYKYGSLAALRNTDKVVTVSSFTQNELINRGVPEDRIQVITNGVDLSRFQPGQKDARLLSKYNLTGKKVLLTVGRLEARKGQDKVIASLPMILQELGDVYYWVVGQGSYREKLERLAQKMGVRDRVIFAGRVDGEDLPRFYRSCDVFIMPNRTLPSGETEGFGLVFLEANACAKPVIGGRAGGVPDAVVDGETGLLVDGTSVGEIAASVVRLLTTPELASSMGESGLLSARRNGWPDKAEQFLNTIDSLLRLEDHLTAPSAGGRR